MWVGVLVGDVIPWEEEESSRVKRIFYNYIGSEKNKNIEKALKMCVYGFIGENDFLKLPADHFNLINLTKTNR